MFDSLSAPPPPSHPFLPADFLSFPIVSFHVHRTQNITLNICSVNLVESSGRQNRLGSTLDLLFICVFVYFSQMHFFNTNNCIYATLCIHTIMAYIPTYHNGVIVEFVPVYPSYYNKERSL